jgi:hypothetical protein
MPIITSILRKLNSPSPERPKRIVSLALAISMRHCSGPNAQQALSMQSDFGVKCTPAVTGTPPELVAVIEVEN